MTLSSGDRLLPVQATDGTVIFPQGMTPPASEGDRFILVQGEDGTPLAVKVTAVNASGQRGIPAALTDAACLVRFSQSQYWLYVFGVNNRAELGLNHTTNTQTPTELTTVRHDDGTLETIDRTKVQSIAASGYGLGLIYDGKLYRSGYSQDADYFCEFELRSVGGDDNVDVNAFTQLFQQAPDIIYDDSGTHVWQLNAQNYLYTSSLSGSHVDFNQSQIAGMSHLYGFIVDGKVYAWVDGGSVNGDESGWSTGFVGVGLLRVQRYSSLYSRWINLSIKPSDEITGFSGATAIAKGGGQTFALMTDGTLKQAGYDETPLDDTDAYDTEEWQKVMVPIPLRGLTGVADIAGSAQYLYAITTDGELYRLADGIFEKCKTIHGVTEIWTGDGNYVVVRCGNGYLRRSLYNTTVSGSRVETWNIIEGIPDAVALALNEWDNSNAMALLDAEAPTSLPDVAHHWAATWNPNTSSWDVEYMGTAYGQDEQDWTDRDGYWDKITAAASPTPDAPSAASDQVYYHWKAIYDFDSSSWTVTLKSKDTWGPAMGWSSPKRGRCFCTTTTSSTPADPTTPGTVYHHWGVDYDCSTSSWGTPTLIEKSFISDRIWYGNGSWLNIFDDERYVEDSRWNENPPDYQFAITTNSASTPSTPATAPTCYYYWSAFWDCWGEEWYVSLDYVDSVGEVSDWDCTEDPWGDYCTCVTTSDTTPADPSYTPTCA